MIWIDAHRRPFAHLLVIAEIHERRFLGGFRPAPQATDQLDEVHRSVASKMDQAIAHMKTVAMADTASLYSLRQAFHLGQGEVFEEGMGQTGPVHLGWRLWRRLWR